MWSFLSVEYPYLASSPDGSILVGNGKFGLVEVKCPYKHLKSSIEVACKNPTFCLSKCTDLSKFTEDNQIALKLIVDMITTFK